MGKTHAEFAVLLKMLIGYEFVMDSYELVMSACEISMIYLCIFETIYAVLLLRVGRVVVHLELELELIQTQMAQKPMLRAEVGMRVRCANKASAE